MAIAVNLHVKNAPTFPALAHHLRTLNALPAFGCGGTPWTSVFPCVGERSAPADVEDLTRALSKLAGGAVIGFWVDAPSRFRFWLFSAGAAVAAYDSTAPDPALLVSLHGHLSEGASREDAAAVLIDRRSRTVDETSAFLKEWRRHRKELREHLLKTYTRESRAPGEPDIVSLLREYDHHTSQMTGAEAAPADAGDLAADTGRLFGLRDDTARIGYREALAGMGPIDATVRLD